MKIKTTKNFKYDATVGNMHAQGRYGSVVAGSMVAMKQLVERESYRRSHMVYSHHHFHDSLKTTTLLARWRCKCVKWVWSGAGGASKLKLKISAGGSTDKSAIICTHKKNIHYMVKYPIFNSSYVYH